MTVYHKHKNEGDNPLFHVLDRQKIGEKQTVQHIDQKLEKREILKLARALEW